MQRSPEKVKEEEKKKEEEEERKSSAALDQRKRKEERKMKMFVEKKANEEVSKVGVSIRVSVLGRGKGIRLNGSTLT